MQAITRFCCLFTIPAVISMASLEAIAQTNPKLELGSGISDANKYFSGTITRLKITLSGTKYPLPLKITRVEVGKYPTFPHPDSTQRSKYKYQPISLEISADQIEVETSSALDPSSSSPSLDLSLLIPTNGANQIIRLQLIEKFEYQKNEGSALSQLNFRVHRF